MKSFVSYEEMLHADSQLAYSETFLTTATSSRLVFTSPGTTAALNLRGGGVSIGTAAADNSEAGVRGAGNIVVPANKKTAWMGAKLSFEEANTSAANVYVGFSSEALATGMQDNGAGPPASYSGLGFFKTDGGSANWSVELSIAGAQTTAELSASNSLDKAAHVAAGATYQYLEVAIYPKTTTTADVIFKIDGVVVYKVMDWVYTSIAAMAPLVMIKSGSATAEDLKLRRVDFAQVI